MHLESESDTMSRHGVPLGNDADLDLYAESVWITVGTAAPADVYTTPLYFNSAGTTSYIWGGTSYVKFRAVA